MTIENTENSQITVDFPKCSRDSEISMEFPVLETLNSPNALMVLKSLQLNNIPHSKSVISFIGNMPALFPLSQLTPKLTHK